MDKCRVESKIEYIGIGFLCLYYYIRAKLIIRLIIVPKYGRDGQSIFIVRSLTAKRFWSVSKTFHIIWLWDHFCINWVIFRQTEGNKTRYRLGSEEPEMTRDLMWAPIALKCPQNLILYSIRSENRLVVRNKTLSINIFILSVMLSSNSICNTLANSYNQIWAEVETLHSDPTLAYSGRQSTLEVWCLATMRAQSLT